MCVCLCVCGGGGGGGGLREREREREIMNEKERMRGRQTQRNDGTETLGENGDIVRKKERIKEKMEKERKTIFCFLVPASYWLN